MGTLWAMRKPKAVELNNYGFLEKLLSAGPTCHSTPHVNHSVHRRPWRTPGLELEKETEPRSSPQGRARCRQSTACSLPELHSPLLGPHSPTTTWSHTRRSQGHARPPWRKSSNSTSSSRLCEAPRATPRCLAARACPPRWSSR